MSPVSTGAATRRSTPRHYVCQGVRHQVSARPVPVQAFPRGRHPDGRFTFTPDGRPDRHSLGRGRPAGRSPNGLRRPGELCRAAGDLPVVAQGATPAYEGAVFAAWVDADDDGCQTRGEFLFAEFTTPPVRATGCAITGAWILYCDEVTATDASALDVDHLLPLAEAWCSEAASCSLVQRKDFANDTGFARPLVAVTASTNRSRGDGDPATWLPAGDDARCRHTAEWVQIKYGWRLAVDPGERDALASVYGCGNSTVDTHARTDVPKPAPTSAPATEPNPGPAQTTGSMSPGQQVAAGTWSISPDRTHGLTFQTDGSTGPVRKQASRPVQGDTPRAGVHKYVSKIRRPGRRGRRPLRPLGT